MADVQQPSVGSPVVKNRPLGVTILAILLILGGLLNLSSVVGSIYMYGILYGAYTGLMGIVGLIVGIGMWQLIPWARKLAIFFYIIGIPVGLLITYVEASILGPEYLAIMLMANAIGWIIPIIVILYLLQGSVKAAFEGVNW